MRLADLLHGPAPPLPRGIDDVAERWARLRPRSRVLIASALVTVLLVAAGGGLRHGRWGPPVDVLVAATDLPAGAALDGAWVVEDRPVDLVAPDALPPSPPAAGHRTTSVVPAGTVLTARHVVAGGPSGLVPDGSADVAVPADLLPDLPVGTRLRVVATRFDGEALLVADGAEVVRVDAERTWLRVAEQDVAGLASAVAGNGLVVAVVP